MTSHKIPDTEEFKGLLKKHGLKSTPQRLAVHETMLRLGHASADMVASEIAATGITRVTVASVYNTLSQLALLGIYSHRLSANNKMYFDVNSCSHIHMYDIVNHTYKDIADDSLSSLVLSHLGRKRFKGYKIEGVDIQIICHPSERNTSSITK